MSLDPKIDQEIARLITGAEEITHDLAHVVDLLQKSLPMRDFMGIRMRSVELHEGAKKILYLAGKIEALRSVEYLKRAPTESCPQCWHSMAKHHETDGRYKCWHGDVAERCRCTYRPTTPEGASEPDPAPPSPQG